MNLLSPCTEAEAADIVRDAASVGRKLRLAGGGTRRLPANTDEALQLSANRLSGIIHYEPAEMVLTAKAGTPVSEIEAVLNANGQMMPFEPWDHRPILGTVGTPTIGGIFAGNVSGSRRLVAGAARDCLLGVRFINGKGEVIRSGGRVMKNVTGLDLVKLLAGSHGTLGFLTEVTFRVLPQPADSGTLLIQGLTENEACRAMAMAMALPVEVTGAAYCPGDVLRDLAGPQIASGGITMLRLEGLATSVRDRAGKLADCMKNLGPTSLLTKAESNALWRRTCAAAHFAGSYHKPLWRMSVAPSEGHRVVEAIRQRSEMDAFYDWQGGLIWGQMGEGDPQAALVRDSVRRFGGGHATLMRNGGQDTVPRLDSVAPAIAALSLRIKAKLDPDGVFCGSPYGGMV